MDKDTRNAIERATQRARALLEDDFASQLEGTFDMAPEFEFEAVFMPIMLQPHWSKQLILGSLDFRVADAAFEAPRRAAAG